MDGGGKAFDWIPNGQSQKSILEVSDTFPRKDHAQHGGGVFEWPSLLLTNDLFDFILEA